MHIFILVAVVSVIAIALLLWKHRAQIRADIAVGHYDVVAAIERAKTALRAEAQALRADVNSALSTARKDVQTGVSAVESRGEALVTKAEGTAAEIEKKL